MPGCSPPAVRARRSRIRDPRSGWSRRDPVTPTILPYQAVRGRQATGVALTSHRSQAVLDGDGQHDEHRSCTGSSADALDGLARCLRAPSTWRAPRSSSSAARTPSANTWAVGYEDPTAATHRFLADMPGYQGWQWAVVVAAYPGADHATISEVVLVPGPTALLAPEWVPWDERVKPGDLGPGDLLAPPADDPAAGARLHASAVTRRSTRSPPRSGWVAAGDSAMGPQPTPRSAGTTATTVPDRRWRGRPGGSAATAASTFRWPGALGTHVRGVRQRDGGRRPRRRVRIRLRCALGHSAPPAPARRCTTPSTTAVTRSPGREARSPAEAGRLGRRALEPEATRADRVRSAGRQSSRCD